MKCTFSDPEVSVETIDSTQSLVETEDNNILLPGDNFSGDVSPLIKDMPDDDSFTWTIYIALAFSPEESEACKVYERGKAKTNPDRGCYHIEYKLLPGDTESVKLDLLLFGPVAKLYKEEESKILKTWTEAGQTWVGWTQAFNVKVDRAMAIRLLSHKITVNIWNRKDKLFSQACFERQRSLRLTQNQLEDTEMTSSVKAIVTKMRSMCQKKCPKNHIFQSTPKLDMEVKSKTLFEPSSNSSFDRAAEFGMTSIHFSPISLLAGELSVTNWALVGSCGVTESMIHISIEQPLLSDQLKAELNPMAITIVSAASMPSSPVPFHVLEETCMPVYCQYKFHNLKMHKTNYERHSDKIYFRDVNVIFTGLLNPQDFLEFLLGPPMKIEIHDRDRKQDDETPVGLGCGFNDIPSELTLKRKTKEFNYHGVVSLNFSELLLGTTNFEVCLPIKPCPPPLDMDTVNNQSVPPGHYYDANSQLRVMINLACPLNFPNIGRRGGSFEALFGRLVYIFHSNNIAVMDMLRMEILKSNAQAFDFDSRVLENSEKALSNYTTHFKRSQSCDLDYVTGFHLVDKKTQIVVVEGLRHKTLRRLWEAVGMKLGGSEEEQVKVLYNSSLVFFKRIYDTLDLSLAPIILPETLESIMMEPLIYVKGTVPAPCLQGLLRLKQLCQVRSLKDAVQYDLFPSAEMILCLSRLYKTPNEEWKQILGVTSQSGAQTGAQTHVPVKSHVKNRPRGAKEFTHCYINNHYAAFRKPKDFIQENIRKVHENSVRIQKPAMTLRLKVAQDRPVHNYSIQTFNTNELNKDWLQQQMAKLPGRRFTYSQEYHSATVEPGEYTVTTPTKDSHPEAAEVFALQDQWPVLETRNLLAIHGSRYFDPRRTWNTSVSRPKMHPKTPDLARVEELRKPWRENILHGNILKSPLSRGPWSWSHHSQDFQLYRKAPAFISPPPVSIHLSGESLQEEQIFAARAQHSRWEKKLLFANRSTSSVPEFKCHMTGTDKLQDLLKDKPQKYSLSRPGLLLKPVPRLSVISHSADVTGVQRSLALAPGVCTDCSLSSRNNAIPRHRHQCLRFDKKSPFLYKRAALPLTEEEKDIFNFTVVT